MEGFCLDPFNKFVTTDNYHQSVWHILIFSDWYNTTNLEYIAIVARVVGFWTLKLIEKELRCISYRN